MAITSNWAPRVTDGHATWKHTCKTRRGGEYWRKKKEREERRKDMKIEIKVGRLNVGTMTGKSREIVDLMECRNVDVLCTGNTGNDGKEQRQGAWEKDIRSGTAVVTAKEMV